MTLASANRAALGYIAESTFGTTPGAGTAKNIRFTGESFSYDLSKEMSKEIRDDRQLSDAITVDATATGGFNFELSYREYDAFLQGALFSDFVVYGTDGVGTTATVDFTATTITNTGAALTGANAYTVLQGGQWFRVVAPAHANDGVFCRVSTSVAPTTTVITVDASTPLATGTGVTSVALQTSRLTNGVTQKFFSIERSMSDVTQFMLYRGMCVSKMDWKIAAGALSEGSFEFMGKDMVRAGTTGLPSALGASQTFKIQNGVTSVGQLWEGTAPTGISIKSIDMSIENNLRSQTAIGTLGAVGIGVGTFRPSGSFEAYFENGNLYDKFLDDEYTQIIVGTQDALGNGYVVTMPRVALMTAKVMAGSKDSDIMAQFTFEALADESNATAALRQTMFIDRVGSVAV